MPSVTFKPVLISTNKHRDGTIPVKIRVTFRGVSRRLPTTLIARPGDYTRTLHIKSPDILNRAQALIARMQATLADLSPFVLEGWDADAVVAHIRARMLEQTFRLDLFTFAEQVLAGKLPQTRRVYDAALNSLADYLGRRKLDINAVTRRLLTDWMEWTDGQTKRGTRKAHGPGLASRNVTRLAHIYHAAQRKYNDDDRTLIPRNPFDGIQRVVPPPAGQRNLGAELMQRIIDDREAVGRERIALDAFVLSFALMGANMADLWAARGVGLVGTTAAASQGPVWVYNRQKTKNKRQDRAEMRVSVPPEVSAFIGRLAGDGEWWLGALHTIPGDKDGCTHKVNIALRGWAERHGVKPFTFYAARKTWASLARRAGVEKATIDECLCHIGDFPVADIYIERDWELLNEANRKTLALLRWDGGVDAQQEKEVDQTQDEIGVLG